MIGNLGPGSRTIPSGLVCNKRPILGLLNHAQPLLISPNHLFKYLEKYAEVPAVARLQDMVLVSAHISPPSAPSRNFESEVYLNVGMPSTHGPAAASSQDVPSQAGLKDVRRRRAT